jgi:hypothetical protein
MYGPHQGEVLVGLVKIVATTTPPLTARVLNLRFNAGTKFPYHFGPELLGEKYNIPYDNIEALMEGPQRRVDDAAPRFEWTEPASADWKTGERRLAVSPPFRSLARFRWTKYLPILSNPPLPHAHPGANHESATNRSHDCFTGAAGRLLPTRTGSS